MTTESQLERRIVSVLFADLVGFTSLSESFDPEDVASIQDAYFAAVRDTIARHGGVVEKFIGDAVMAVFGLPRGRDDDAERAVRAGLALVEAVERLGARLGRDDVALQLRVGVNSGEVVATEAGPDQGRVTGDTVNVAARFQSAASPGEVLVGQGTALAVADAVELESQGVVELKGKAAPVAVWRVTRLRPERSREAAMGRLRAPMLGREGEVAALTSAAERTTASGTAERWVIVAPPGTGKSRLLTEFAAWAGRSPGHPAVWKARLRAGGLAPYDGVAQLLAAALTDQGRDPADTSGTTAFLRESLREAGASEDRASVVAAEVTHLLHPTMNRAGDTVTSASERETRFDAWREALDALAVGRPSVWLLEDVHWAGGDLLAFLDHAQAWAPSGGRLILATARPSLLESAPSWCREDSGDGSTRVLHLEALSAAAATDLVHALVGEALPDQLAAQIASRADGNPLFIEELLRTWVSVGTLREDDGRWHLTVEPSTVPLPATVQAIYAAQLDDLPADARTVARRASVAGKRFPADALPALGVVNGRKGVDGLSRRAFVSGPTQESLVGPAYSYRHALLRDAGYASLARAERARLHVRMARWLEAVAADRTAEVADRIAEHYATAVESAPALATDVAEGLGREEAARMAATWFDRAADRALGLAAHEATRSLIRRAIELTPATDSLALGHRWLRLGEATAFSADMDEGRRHAEQALDLYRSVWRDEGAARPSRDAARSGMAESSWLLGDIAWQQVRFLECRDLAQEVLDEIGQRDDLPTARLLVQRARGHYGETDEIGPPTHGLERALAITQRLGDERLALEARHALQIMRLEHGEAALEPWREIGALAERLGDWTKVVRASSMPAGILADDHAAAAREPNELARRIAEAHGLTEQVGWADYRRAEFDLVAGAWDDVLLFGLRAIELAERNAYRRLGVRTWFAVAFVAAQRGDVALGERCRGYFDGLEGPQPDSPYARVMVAALDLVLADLGLREPFVPEVEPRVPAYRDTPMGLASFCVATDRIFQAWLDHDPDGAQRILPDIRASASMSGSTELARATVDLLEARFGAVIGTPSDVVAKAARSALARSRAIDAPWWIAKSIRALESVDGADPRLAAEAVAIERDLGIVRTTGRGPGS